MNLQKQLFKGDSHSIYIASPVKICSIVAFFLLLLFSCNRAENESESYQKQVQKIATIELEELNGVQINERIKRLSFEYDSIANVPSVEGLRAIYAYKIGSLYMRKRVLDSAVIYFDVAHQYFQRKRNKYNPLRAKLYSDYGYTKFLADKNIKDGSQFLNEAIAIVVADSVKNEISPYEKVIVLTNASEISFVMNKFYEAIDFNHLALRYIPKIEKGPTRSHYTFRAYYELFNLQAKLVDTNTDSLAKYLRRIKVYTPNDMYKRFYHKLKGIYFLETDEPDSAIHYFTKAHEYDIEQMKLRKGRESFTDYYNLLEIQLNLALALLESGQLEKAKAELEIFEEKYYHKLDASKIDDDILEIYHIASSNYYSHFKDIEKYSYHQEQLKELIEEDLKKSNHDSYDKISSLNLVHQKESSLSNLSENFQKETKKLFFLRAALFTLGLIIVFAGAFAGNFHLQRRNAEIIQEKERISLKNKLLKTQLEPRFILNTLNNLNYLIDIDKQKDAVAFLDDFGLLLRNTVQQTQDDLIPIEDEIQFLTSYCQLQKITHNDNFEYEIEVDEKIDVEAFAISPFLIQPYVENAILDPSNNYEGSCKLTVSFKIGQGEIIVDIQADNQNFKDENDSESPFFNIISQERFELLSKQFGSEKQFAVEDKSNGKHRWILIQLPYKEI